MFAIYTCPINKTWMSRTDAIIQRIPTKICFSSHGRHDLTDRRDGKGAHQKKWRCGTYCQSDPISIYDLKSKKVEDRA